MMTEKNEKNISSQKTAVGFSIGVVFAVTFWIITDNLIMAIAVGIVAGVGISAFGPKKQDKIEDDENQ